MGFSCGLGCFHDPGSGNNIPNRKNGKGREIHGTVATHPPVRVVSRPGVLSAQRTIQHTPVPQHPPTLSHKEASTLSLVDELDQAMKSSLYCQLPVGLEIEWSDGRNNWTRWPLDSKDIDDEHWHLPWPLCKPKFRVLGKDKFGNTKLEYVGEWAHYDLHIKLRKNFQTLKEFYRYEDGGKQVTTASSSSGQAVSGSEAGGLMDGLVKERVSPLLGQHDVCDSRNSNGEQCENVPPALTMKVTPDPKKPSQILKSNEQDIVVTKGATIPCTDKILEGGSAPKTHTPDVSEDNISPTRKLDIAEMGEHYLASVTEENHREKRGGASIYVKPGLTPSAPTLSVASPRGISITTQSPLSETTSESHIDIETEEHSRQTPSHDWSNLNFTLPKRRYGQNYSTHSRPAGRGTSYSRSRPNPREVDAARMRAVREAEEKSSSPISNDRMSMNASDLFSLPTVYTNPVAMEMRRASQQAEAALAGTTYAYEKVGFL